MTTKCQLSSAGFSGVPAYSQILHCGSLHKVATQLRLNPNHLPYLRARQAGTSGIGDFHGLTGGVYKTRERIHGSVLTYRY